MPTNQRQPDAVFDVAVVGAGPVGLAVALNISRANPSARLALIAPEPQWGDDPSEVARPDLRTAALFHDSLELLHQAGAVELEKHAEPLRGIRMIDVSDRLLRAPDVMFLASETKNETGHDTFGANISNAAIMAALEKALIGWADECPGALTRTAASVAANANHLINEDDDCARLMLTTGETISARVVIAADGRDSTVRQLAGIPIRSWDHDQVAMTTRFAHTRPHNGISTELHGNGGPCTTVPLCGCTSSLVWMERKTIAEGLMADTTGDEAGARFASALNARVAGFLGPISNVIAPKRVELRSQIAQQFSSQRLMLVGDAAHAFPPIGAQGLNLGFRDAAAAIAIVNEHLLAGSDPGALSATKRYHSERAADIHARSTGVDLLNRSLIAELPLLPLARGAGLHAVRAIPMLRRLLMRQGMRGLPRPPSISPFTH